MRRIVNVFTFLMLFAAAAMAADYADLYVIPAAAHARGANGSVWRSDVVLHNFQVMPISVQLALVENGAVTPLTIGGESALHLNSGETRALADVLGALGRDAGGALIVGAELPFAVTSRTYAQGTLGETVPAVAIGSAADAASDVAVLAGLADGGGRRSNVGAFVAAARGRVVVEIALLSASGASLGTRVVTVEDGGFAHQQFPVNAAAAVVRIVAGEGIVVPYASTVDNASSETLFLSGAPVGRGGAARALIANAVAAQ